ncbi:MAG: hypothetical protein AB7I27_10195 [Bacteriovoracaceae bacterium]
MSIDINSQIRKLPENGNKEISPSEHVIDWKKILNESLSGRSSLSIQIERNRASLTQSMRELCPETNWLFIFEGDYRQLEIDHSSVIKSWLEKLVTLPEWPFPEQVIIICETTHQKSSWYLLFSNKLKMSKMPFSELPDGLIATPYKDKYSVGWKISLDLQINLGRTGNV